MSIVTGSKKRTKGLSQLHPPFLYIKFFKTARCTTFHGRFSGTGLVKVGKKFEVGDRGEVNNEKSIAGVEACRRYSNRLTSKELSTKRSGFDP